MLTQDNLILADGQRSPQPQTSFLPERVITKISPALPGVVFWALITPVILTELLLAGLVNQTQFIEIRRLEEPPKSKLMNENWIGSICLG